MTITKAAGKNKPKRAPAPKEQRAQIQRLRLNGSSSRAWTTGLFLLHGAALALLFDPLQGIVNNRPIIEQDWGLHFHHLKSLETLWREDKSFWGYNPLFMAGYPSNTIQDLSIKFFEIAALGLGFVGLTPIQWFKILAFLAMACVPWLMYFATRNLFFNYENKNLAALSAAILGTAYWWNSLPREMFFYGMIGYVSGAYVSVLGVSLFYRIANESSMWTRVHVAWLLFVLTILPLHLQATFITMPPILALFIASPRLLKPGLVLWIVGAAGFSLSANLFWLAPAINHRGDDVSGAIVEQLSLFVSSDPFTFLKDYLAPTGYWTFRPSFWEKGYRLMLLIIGVMGTVLLLRGRRKDLGFVFAAALATLFLISYFGSLSALVKPWQPMRFKVSFDLFLVLTSSYFLAQWLTGTAKSSPYTVPSLLICGALAFLINVVQTESLAKMKLRTSVRPEISVIVEWIKHETPPDGRVLFEESGDETGFVYDGMYLSSFIPHWTGRQLIGGPINLYNDRHHFAEFHSGKLFKQDVQTLTDEEIKSYFRLYNIGAVVAFHPASLQRLRSVPGLVVLDQRIGPIHLMKVNQTLSWFLVGDGKIKIALNRLEASEVKGAEATLKFHWTEGLAADPALQMIPVKIADDPIPFIKVIDPPTHFALRLNR
jgi:hypothetical protein